MLADRVSRIQGSVTLEMTARAGELKAAGVDVINLSVGEPDFNTPDHIIAAGKAAMDAGYTRYTAGPGMPELRQVIADKVKRDNNITVEPAQVIASNGGKHALFNALMTLFQAGDEVIIFAPYWVSFPEMVKLAHATPVTVSTDPERQFEPRFEELEAAITSRTRGIIVNSPSNPTGGVWSREAVDRIVAVARKHNLWLFSDECYEALSYDLPFESPAGLYPDYERILTFQSCSKTYAMTGWRCGYMLGPVEVVSAMSKIQGQSTSSPNSIAQMAAIAALSGDQQVVADMKAAFRNRRDLIVERMNEIPGISCAMPGGAFYVFPDVSGLFGKKAGDKILESPRHVTEYLLDEAHVVTVFGEGFGDQEHIRVSYAVSEEQLEEAARRIGTAVANLQ